MEPTRSLERVRRDAAVIVLDNCEHVVDAVADLVGAAARRRTRAAHLVHESASARPRWREPCRARTARDRRRGRAVREPGESARRQTLRCRSSVPRPRRVATRDRARGRPHADVVGRRDRPAARRSLPGARRSDESEAGTAPHPSRDHRVELRPAVSRRSEGTVGARHVRGRCAARRDRARDRGARCASLGCARRGRPARQPLARPRRRGSVSAARQHPGVRARGDGGHRHCGRRAQPMARRPRRGVDRRRAQRDQAAHLDVARAERANIDAALAWCATHDPQRGREIATGFGWAWIVLGDSRGADRLRAATASIDGLLLTAWIEASTGALVGAREHIAQAQALADDDFSQAKCLYHLAYVVSHEGDFAQAIELTAQARALYGEDGPPWDRAANALFALRAGDLGRRSRSRRRASRRGRTLPRARRRPVAAHARRGDAR